MKIVAFVPIKLNSQRLPNKNILPLNGKPLCMHICETLKNVKNIDEIYVFCSDERIKNYIPENINYLKRSSSLDTDKTKILEVCDSFVNIVDADIYILSHATAPFLKSETIEDALEKVISEDFDSSFAAEKIQTFAWYRGEPINYDVNDIPRTQDMEPIWIETSSFFIFRKEVLTKHHRRIGFKPYIKEVEKIEAIDIDNKSDYDFAVKVAKNI